jgi:hypothetical protein
VINDFKLIAKARKKPGTSSHSAWQGSFCVSKAGRKILPVRANSWHLSYPSCMQGK